MPIALKLELSHQLFRHIFKRREGFLRYYRESRIEGQSAQVPGVLFQITLVHAEEVDFFSAHRASVCARV